MAHPEAPGYYPAYGAPQPPPPKRPVGLIVGAIIAVAVLIMVAGGVIAAVYVSNRGGDEDRAVPSSAPSGGTTDPAQPQQGDSTADSSGGDQPTSGRGSIGKPVRQGDLLITVTAAPRCGAKSIGSGYGVQESEKGHYCLIDLKFENTGSKAVKPKQFSTELIDEAGGETAIELFSYKANPDDKLDLFENIYPGKTVTGVIAFDLPVDQKPATLVMNPVGEYDDSIEISLK